MPHMRCRRFNATRSAVRIERARPERKASGVDGATFAPAAAGSSHARSGSSRAKHAPGDGQPRDDALGFGDELAARARARRDGRLGGDVGPADVLGQKRAQPLVEIRPLEAPSTRYDSSSMRSRGFSAASRISSGSTISGFSSRRQR